jgi:hypothetical protein
MSARNRRAAAKRHALDTDPAFIAEVIAAAEAARLIREAKEKGMPPPVIVRQIPYTGVIMPASVKRPGIGQRRRERREAAAKAAQEFK